MEEAKAKDGVEQQKRSTITIQTVKGDIPCSTDHEAVRRVGLCPQTNKNRVKGTIFLYTMSSGCRNDVETMSNGCRMDLKPFYWFWCSMIMGMHTGWFWYW